MLSLIENVIKLQGQANTQPNNLSLNLSMLQVKKSKMTIDDSSYKVVEFLGSNNKVYINPNFTKFIPRVAPTKRPAKNAKEQGKI
uniref:N-acetylmuramoyl-L-alanine amidase n=1 Tax=Strongyloides venezuelensis TaxID=75913 RepID=A0A0K0FFK4_STRVS